MRIDEISEFLGGLDGVLILQPAPGDGTPEISWGDSFFYYAPDGVIPQTQPFATIVTKDYPDDASSRLDRPGAFRLNLYAGKEAFVAWIGREPRDPASDEGDPSVDDAVIAHPTYGSLGWLSVVNPGPSTEAAVADLLRTAHDLAQARCLRRADA